MTTTNGLDRVKVYDALKNRVLWNSQSIASESLRYFEDFHPLCDTSILDAMRPQSGTLADYLASEQRAIVFQCLNAIYTAPQIIDPAKLVFERGDTILYPQPVPNTNQFVGLKILIAAGDHAIKMNSLELFFTEAKTFNMYLYNDMTLAPIYTKSVTVSPYEQVIIDLSTDAIMNYLTPTVNKGGLFYFGYYQADLGTCQAVYYPIFNTVFHPCSIWSYSAPLWTDPAGNRNFQRNNIGANNLTYGMNVEVTTYVDATNNIVQAAKAGLFDEFLGLVMAARVVKNLIFSYQTNGTQRAVQAIAQLPELYAQLNGVKVAEDIPYVEGLKNQIDREMRRVKATFQKTDGNTVGF